VFSEGIYMIKNGWAGIIVAVFVLIAVGALVWWLFYDPAGRLTLSVPGMDKRTSDEKIPALQVSIGSEFTLFREMQDVPGTRWPRFRGEDYDNISKEDTRLIENWEAGGPRILWKKDLGEGHAAPAVYDGKVYVLDYDEKERADMLRCFSLASGEELWRRGYKVHLKRNHGLSRTVPAVSEKFVLTLGPKGHAMCVNRTNGDFLWGLDVAGVYTSEIPFWYTGQCPLMDGDTAIIATGGKSLMVALDCNTGRAIWETPNPGGWKMSHSSVMPMTFMGKKMYVYFAIGGICGISASGADRGTVLWKTSEFSPAVVAPSPVMAGEGMIFVTAGYGAGSALLQVTGKDGQFSVAVRQIYKPNEGLASEQQTPVFYDGYLYGILPKDAGALRNQFACYRANDCKTVVLSSGRTERFGMGPYILADGKFYILNDDGEMTIARVSPTKFRILDRKRIIDGQDSWGPMAITGGYLLMRDSRQMVCMDIKAL